MKWQKHDGKEMPCDKSTRVVIRQRDGWIDRATAGEFGWKHRTGFDGKPFEGDIVEWRLQEDGL